MKDNPSVEEIPGFKIATAAAGIRDWSKPRADLALVVADAPSPAAGVFTQNKVAAAPVKVDKRHLKTSGGTARAILVNAGVANACTGDEGKRNAMASARQVAEALGAAPEQVLVCSTGVIGRQLPMDRMESGVKKALIRLGKAKKGDFAKAIMTTDLRPKEAGIVVPELGGAMIAGCCKGSGMIAPNMATMLAFVLTDAAVAPGALQKALSEVADGTFNSVTVDGDTSTNDTLLIMAGGTSGAVVDKPSGRKFSLFLEALRGVCLSLAEQIARDGEGATKLVRVKVANAARRRDARRAAKTIAESPLVKTAMFGNDPNWGRVIAALGRSGAEMDEGKVSMRLCGEWMFRHGVPLEFDKAALSAKMKAPEVDLEVDLAVGGAEAMFLTCDFSYEYVKINADYTT